MIYYVEDDDNIRELVVYTLNQMSLPCQGFAESASFHAALEEAVPDLILLDIMLPGEDGLTLLRHLRADQRTTDITLINVTAKGSEFDKVQGLDLGADDYIAKPFGMAELAARVRARLRRDGHKSEKDLLTCGQLTIDRRGHRIYIDEQEVALTFKEYELLLLLMENRGTAFTREQLLDQVWDISYVGGTRTVDVHIQTLRSQLGVCGSYIETVRGVGYRFGGV